MKRKENLKQKNIGPQDGEIKDRLDTHLRELRDVSSHIADFEDLVPLGSQIQRGLRLVHREVQSAEEKLERLRVVARAQRS